MGFSSVAMTGFCFDGAQIDGIQRFYAAGLNSHRFHSGWPRGLSRGEPKSGDAFLQVKIHAHSTTRRKLEQRVGRVQRGDWKLTGTEVTEGVTGVEHTLEVKDCSSEEDHLSPVLRVEGRVTRSEVIGA